MSRCEICGCPSGLHDSDCRADPTKNDLNVGYQAGQVDGRVRVSQERDLFEGLVHELIAAIGTYRDCEMSKSCARAKAAIARIEAARKARPIGYRHNPCQACGKQVTTPGRTLCLGCVCVAADAANLRIPDLAKLMIERLAQVDEAEIAADLAPLTHAECAARGIRHSSTDHHYTALSDADTDEHCRQALRSAGRRCGL
jgi:hypothetical protein